MPQALPEGTVTVLFTDVVGSTDLTTRRGDEAAQEILGAQPEVRRWYARMLIDRDGPGDRDKARELLTEAIAMYRKIGMPKHVEMAEAMLHEL